MVLQVLEEFIQKEGQRTGMSSKYTNFFVELEKIPVGQVVSCEPVLDTTRTIAHNKTNISSCAGKWIAKNEKKVKFQFLTGTVNKPKMGEDGKTPVMDGEKPVMVAVETLAVKRTA